MLGDLSERARQRVTQPADDADVRLRAPRQFWGKLEHAQQQASAIRPPMATCGGDHAAANQTGAVVFQGFSADGGIVRRKGLLKQVIKDTKFERHLLPIPSLVPVALRP